MRRDAVGAVTAAGLPARNAVSPAHHQKGTTGTPAVARSILGRMLTMQSHGTSWFVRAVAVAFAVSCVPLLVGGVIVYTIALGVDQ